MCICVYVCTCVYSPVDKHDSTVDKPVDNCDRTVDNCENSVDKHVDKFGSIFTKPLKPLWKNRF